MAAAFSGPQIIPHLEENVDFTLFQCAWVPCSPRFVVMGSKLTGEGVVQVYSMSPKELKKLGQGERPKAIKCGTFGATSLEERHLATGDFGGQLCLWDLEDLRQPVVSIQAHDDFINAVDGVGGLGVGKGSPEIATASRDGKVKVWDIRVKERPVACMQPKEGETKRDAWAVAFGNCHSESSRMLVSGYDNGDLKMFDLRSMKLFWEKAMPNGICSVQFDRKDIEMNKLLVTGLEGKFHVFDLRTFHSEEGFAEVSQKVDKTTLWCGEHLPQNRDLFMTCGGSGAVNLWKYEYPEKRSKLNPKEENVGVPGSLKKLQEFQMGEQPVSSFDWSPDKTGLGLCTSFDQKIRIVIVTRLNTL